MDTTTHDFDRLVEALAPRFVDATAASISERKDRRGARIRDLIAQLRALTTPDPEVDAALMTLWVDMPELEEREQVAAKEDAREMARAALATWVSSLRRVVVNRTRPIKTNKLVTGHERGQLEYFCNRGTKFSCAEAILQTAYNSITPVGSSLQFPGVTVRRLGANDYEIEKQSQ